MDAGLIFGLLKIALEVWQDERRDRFTKKLTGLRKDYREELKKEEYDSTNPEHKKGDQSRFRSELNLDNILFECKNIAQLVVGEAIND